MRIRWMIFGSLLLAACSNSNGASTTETLTSVTAATSTACPNGGVTILSGIDTNGNGVLDASEVTSTNNVCSGSTPAATHASLVTTTMLAVGDSHCPDGGTEIDTGLDNGAGGGTADDGILQPGEITSTQYVCNGAVTISSLVATTTLPIGDANCPNGGTEIDTGLDNGAGGGIAGDDILQAGEITSTQFVCNGSSAVNSLVSETTLAIGDTNCANGGVEIDSGLDNGAGGGTAGDGILQAGEITSTQYVCNASDGNGPALYVGSMTPPDGPAGAFTINTSGGDGITDRGGNGGLLSMQIENGTLGGHIKIFNTGVAYTNFAIPDVEFVPGAVPFVVTTDTTLATYADVPTGVNSTDAFFEVVGDFSLYANLDGTATPVTSIDIEANATLTFANNLNGSNDLTIVGLTISNDIRNAGTVTTSVLSDGKSASSLNLNVNNYIGTESSSILLAGADSDDTVGGNGAALNIDYTAVFVNAGNINTSGGAGPGGGNGGSIEVNANNNALAMFNTGTLDSHGGDGSTGAGGNGGGVQLEGQYGAVNNSGDLIANGGSGVTAGGIGTYIELDANNTGSVINAGTLYVNGGSCSGVGCTAGIAGGGGLYVNGGGDLLNSGDVYEFGGDAPHGTAGDGQSFDFENNDGDSANDGNTALATGSIRCSGSIDTHGGSGATPGSGAQITFDLRASNNPLGQEIELLGYTNLILKGGSSAATSGITGIGGTGGSITMRQSRSATSPGDNQSNYGPAGAVINYANILAQGGRGGFSGGDGGTVLLTTQRDTNFSDSFELAINFGTVDVDGGAGPREGGSAGTVEFDGIEGVQNNNTINADGGQGTGIKGSGGNASSIQFTSDEGAVQNTGELTAIGGVSAGSDGGTGGSINMFGFSVSNSGALTCDGGDAVTSPGDGGSIALFSSVFAPTANTGALSAAGGTGDPEGLAGSIQIDGSTIQ